MKKLISGIVGCLLCTSAYAALNPAESQKVVHLDQSHLPELVGQPYTEYAIYAVNEDKLKAIPHQFVDYTDKGLPYFTEDPFAEKDDHGTIGIFDKTDELQFLLTDAGVNRLAEDQVKDSREIAIKTSNGPRYIYLKKHHGEALSPVDYAEFDIEKAEVTTPSYTLKMNPENIVMWEDFLYKDYTVKKENGEPQTILDTMKMRMYAGILTKYAKVTLNNKNLKAKVLKVKDGPIADQVLTETKVYKYGVPVLKLYMYFVVYPQESQILSRFELPRYAKGILKEPGFSLSLDGYKLDGSTIRVSVAPEKVGIIDGEISEAESEIQSAQLKGGDTMWVWLETPNKFNMLSFVEFDKKLDVPIFPLFEDSHDAKNGPERFPGQSPNAGFIINSLPLNQELIIKGTIAYSSDIAPMSVQEYVDDLFGPAELIQ